ncbi:AMP-binding protein [Paenibacillus sp. UNC451MF]|uniref:AMP-binding protein n=1 Tax=Paenibacillus sp. UNC451MF TaxID=1449063 RepID=UPI00048D893C|nr:AMP-binding protein [Paenibacillus sp. UNC451MF]
MSVPLELQQTLERMARQYPWYALEADGKQLDGGGEWERLPLITASLLEKHYYSDHNPLSKRDDLNRYQTSGTSSNRRKTIFYSEADEEAYMRIKLDVFRHIVGYGGFHRALADMGTGHAEATAVGVFRRLGMEVESVSFRLPIARHLDRLAQFRPEVLYTMPSILDRILLASEDPTVYGIRHVILVGEMASPVWIQRAAEQLGLNVQQITDTYGSIEIGTIAYFSHEHGRYLLTEGLLAEGIAAEDIGEHLEPLVEADEQVLVLTSTLREAFPAIRYVTYDIVRDMRPILVDGVLRQSFHSVVKRIGPDLKHGEKISIYDIEDVVYRHLNAASVRVKVTGNALSVSIYSPDAEGEVLKSIRSDLENRIPEIGAMIRAGILEGIQVIGAAFDDSDHRSSVKNKKISYEVEG